tara:strand:- start:1720 stop:2673 length:954 start_codon:yes stop_codon:yes gene_type:complete
MTNFYGQYIGFGAGGVAAVPYAFQGTIEGYSIGGSSSSGAVIDVIDKYSFASDTANATNVGDLVTAKGGGNCSHSSTYGYIGGGGTGSSSGTPYVDVIEKLAFASGGNSVAQTAVLLAVKSFGASASTNTFGYHMGGYAPSSDDQIEKYSMVADTDATVVGDLSENKSRVGGASSETHGYAMGGVSPNSNVVDKFSFASESVSGNVAQLTVSRGNSGANSTTYGYAFGGYAGHPVDYQDEIDRFSFASEGAAGDVGNLTVAGAWGSSTCSTTHGYTCGGDSRNNVIDRVSFESGGDAADVGDPFVTKQNMGSAGWSY